MDLSGLESFALAEDRSKVLEQLIPGTEDCYYYHCLHFQQTGDREAYDKQLEAWIERHGHTSQVDEITARQALLDWDRDRDGALHRIQDSLRVQHSHQRQVEGQRTSYPSRLDVESLREQFKSYASGWSDLNRYTDRALDWLCDGELSDDQRRHMLDRLQRPDHPRMVDMVLADLDYEHSGGFGARNVHSQLLLEQLEELRKRRADLLKETTFVELWLTRLRPNPDVEIEHDLAEREAHLGRLWSFVSPLALAFNPLKAHVLYHWLELDHRRGVLDRERFLAYLRLPRPTSYANPDYLKLKAHRHHHAHLGQSFPTGLPVVSDDEPLVRELLARVLVEADDFAGLEEFVRKDYLRRLRAIRKILAGVGDMETWYSELDDPSAYQELKERVDIEFAPTNPAVFGRDDSVELEVDVKNVKTLVVKVFAINSFNYFTATGGEPDTAVDLDGLVASDERTFTYEEPPLRRVRRRLEFPSLQGPGVWVVELIGGGRSSRALIRKGTLRPLERVGAAGHVFRILDEREQPVPEATLRLGGREYTPDEQGEIVVPFSTNPGRRQILLRHGELTALDQFEHRAEHYQFSAGIHVDREGLLAKQEAQVFVRPTLRMDGRPVSLKLLSEPVLVITSSDRHGVTSSKELTGFELFADRESIHTFQVPEDLSSIAFELRAKVKKMSGGEQSVSASRAYSLNAIDQTDRVEALHMARTEAGYVVYLLGKTGEPRVDTPVSLTFGHEDYTDSHSVTLQTDAYGRIELGSHLEGFTSVQVNASASGVSASWPLERPACRQPATVHALAGETVALPYLGASQEAGRKVVSFLERRGDAFVHDRRETLVAIQDGFLELRGLPAGDYDLFLRETEERIAVRVTDGRAEGPWAVSSRRYLERSEPKRLHLPSVEVSADELRVKVANASSRARVHVVATRFQPNHSIFAELGPFPLPAVLVAEGTPTESHYVSGRDIGEEYRYILERRFAARLPGNMLTRPGLLLNPWAVRKTDTDVADAAAGSAYDKKAAKPRRGGRREDVAGMAQSQAGGGFANLDFLEQPAVVVPNLQADAQGWVKLPRAALKGANQVRVVAVDRVHTVWREVTLTEDTTAHQDLRLRLGLDPQGHFTERKQVSALSEGSLVLEDITTSQLEHYDTLGKAYGLFATLSDGDEHLTEFGFVLRWPTLEKAEKRRLYSEYACHELHLFLSHKDPEFFAEVVRPYLANKRHKTFLDHYLLEDDLSDYLLPWSYGRLNVVERILLGKRLAGESPHTRRHVEDRCDLIPPNVEQDDHLFRTAIQGSALDADDVLGMGAASGMAESVFGAVMDAMPMGGGGPGMEMLASRAMAMPASMAPPPAPKSKRSRRSASKKKAKLETDELMDMEEEACEEPWEEDDDDEGGADFFSDGEMAKEKQDLGRRDQVRQLYRRLDATQELAENNYYKLEIDEQGPELVEVNRFWRDFARHGSGPFLSEYTAEAHGSFTEMMCALSVLDLPFEATAPQARYEGARMELVAGGPIIVFHKEIKPAEAAEQRVPILVSQNYFRADDRYRYEGNEQFDKYVGDEFLTHVVYLCQVVLTNPTSSPHKLDLLLQIPQGAIQVSNGFKTRGRHVHLAPYNTQSIEYSFYFPVVGDYAHYPVHVAKYERLIAHADPTTLHVVLEPSTVDTTSWAWISQNGSEEEVLAYLEEHNVERLDLEKIAWRMRETGFFEKALALLTKRHAYSQVLWSYGLYHKHTAPTREFLLHEEDFLDECGRWLESPLVDIDPVGRGRYEHLEYFPLVNARAHRLGAKLRILNDRFAWQYQRKVELLGYKPTLDDDDWLAVAYYLFLQDRAAEGLDALSKVAPEKVSARLQLDYLRVYAAFYRQDVDGARVLAEKHRHHPVDRWRKLFQLALAQMDEAEGEAAQVVDPEDRDQAQGGLAASEPSFEFEVSSGELVLRYQNLKACRVNLYSMDIELLFSRQPFVQQQSGQFSFIAPNHTQELELPSSERELRLPLPDGYRSTNAMVEVVSAGIRRAEAHYANDLSVQLIEGYGQVGVHDKEGRPLPKVYVKAYARFHGGQVRFYKDGYTDLRGRFDYASLSTDDLERVERFALLVLSDEQGAVIREAAPPKR